MACVLADNDEGMFRSHTQALDSSGKGNHLPLINPPAPRPAIIPMPPAVPGPNVPLITSALQFRNNFAMSKSVSEAGRGVRGRECAGGAGRTTSRPLCFHKVVGFPMHTGRASLASHVIERKKGNVIGVDKEAER